MKRLDALLLVASTLLGLVVVYSAVGMGLTYHNKPGSGLFPFLIGLLMAMVSGSVLVTHIFRVGLSADATARSDCSGQKNRTRVTLVYALLIVYTLSLRYFGFATSSLLLMIVLLRCVGLKSWMYSIGMSVCVVIPITAVAVYVLKIQLPVGMFGY